MAKVIRITKQEAERRLANVPEEYVFWCCDGRILRNMQELRDALSRVTDGIFNYHANAQKNDFSNWVKDIIQDKKLARDLMKSASRVQAAKVVETRLAFLSSKLA